jgi:DNA-directed RNA polymerase subunit RPC12/RpoP
MTKKKKQKKKYKCNSCGKSLSCNQAIKKDNAVFCRTCQRKRVKSFYIHDDISAKEFQRYQRY